MNRKKFLQSLGSSMSVLGGVPYAFSTVQNQSIDSKQLTKQLDNPNNSNPNYRFNRKPLRGNFYSPLPVGDVKPKGWLKEQLDRMANGLAGKLDQFYPIVGKENAWVGGNGDNWERAPYWLDGLVPLAYILEDQELIDKAQKYIEWTLKSQKTNGYFGPDSSKKYKSYKGRTNNFIQTNNAGDWWPRMIMLKVLQSYYSVTGDERVIDFMTKYFKYQQQMLEKKPLDHWTFWSGARGGENQASIYWLYNRTGDEFLLDLAQKVFEQTYDWTNGFLLDSPPNTHAVNVAMGIKQPAVNYLQTHEEKYLQAVEQGIDFLMHEHGQPQGMYSGDEPLHGKSPVQGTELCTIVEFMNSLRTVANITGHIRYADHLEKIVFNALPTQHSDDYMTRQYFQQPNQPRLSKGHSNFVNNETHDGLRACFGLNTGYPCCTTNMHQGWPKYVHSLWMASNDGGLAALFYGASEVKAKVGDGIEVRFEEYTNYPFDESIKFKFSSDQSVEFPLHLRIPEWVDGQAIIQINGKTTMQPKPGQIIKIERTWQDGDTLNLTLPKAIQIVRLKKQADKVKKGLLRPIEKIGRWPENAASVEYGPLVYALHIEGEKKELHEDEYNALWDVNYNVPTWVMNPTSAWNYGLKYNRRNLSKSFKVIKEEQVPNYPWSADSVPIKILAKGHKIPQWDFYNNDAGPLPFSPVSVEHFDEAAEEITLIPYGATTLRISLFPVVE